jgi:hypothetical protein
MPLQGLGRRLEGGGAEGLPALDAVRSAGYDCLFNESLIHK